MQRAFTTPAGEIKQAAFNLSVKSLNEEGVFSGYASVFNIVDSHKDIISQGAFRRSLKENGHIKLLWQHHADEPIGRLTRIEEDNHGLYVEGALLLDVQRAKEALALLRSGAIEGMSIGYTPVAYHYDPDTGVRVLTDVDLWEVSLVTFPANDAAEVTHIKNSSDDDTPLAGLEQAINRAIAALSGI